MHDLGGQAAGGVVGEHAEESPSLSHPAQALAEDGDRQVCLQELSRSFGGQLAIRLHVGPEEDAVRIKDAVLKGGGQQLLGQVKNQASVAEAGAGEPCCRKALAIWRESELTKVTPRCCGVVGK